jgi:hypothetical protein
MKILLLVVLLAFATHAFADDQQDINIADIAAELLARASTTRSPALSLLSLLQPTSATTSDPELELPPAKRARLDPLGRYEGWYKA